MTTWDDDLARIALNGAVSVPARSGAAARKRAKEGTEPRWKKVCGLCFQPRSAHGSAGGSCAQFVEPSEIYGQSDYKDAMRGRNRSPGLPMIAHDDELPPGPYTVGVSSDQKGRPCLPYVIRCGDGRAVAGFVNSIQCALAIATALNVSFPEDRR